LFKSWSRESVRVRDCATFCPHLTHLVVVLVIEANGLRVSEEVLVGDVVLNMAKEINDELLMLGITIIQLAVVPVVGVPVASRYDGNE
jgi:hypothetical protein